MCGRNLAGLVDAPPDLDLAGAFGRLRRKKGRGYSDDDNEDLVGTDSDSSVTVT
jgi:hypothetical protein